MSSHSLKGAIIVSTVAGFLIFVGILAIIDPKMQGARDVNIIQSDEIGAGEKFASRIGGIFLVITGLLLLFFVGYVSSGYGF